MATKKATVPAKGHLWNPLKLYFLIMSLVGVIGSLITLGIVSYTIGKQLIITNDEYIAGDRYYEMDACNTNMIAKPTTVNPNNVAAPTQEEIAKCKGDKKAWLIESRRVTFKQDMLNGSIRGVLFIILLLTHLPKFIRVAKKAE